jgi:lysophospholipase L1-like esterase
MLRLRFLLVVALAACGSASQPVGPDEDGSSPSEDAATTDPDAAGLPDAASDSMAGADSGPQGLATLGALVVLGDSISDGGGSGPFYYDLLKQDLAARYGMIAYQNKAQSGSKTGALSSQIDSLPKTLAGPVAVCITSGGNDMKAALPLIIAGTDQAARTQMGTNIQTALTKLLAPGRFGTNVPVHVFEANIYDASAGKGDFGSHGCAFGQGLPTLPSDAWFASWNGVISMQVSSKSQVLADIHKHFYAHGYAGNPSWFASDCTHPNTLGHDQLRRLFYLLITGKAL